ncbi:MULTISPECIES: relaxase/mobilization nuclease RlxS [unclassified Sphingomonas]|uniref:relaxase/mobilization nuclease RlxS n=1 Tax=unclassified Sphingomonas TaxID=196159 RepID=UPI0006FD967A|nr:MULTISPECIES: relaxase/mobilization nuclease RlxS [unclassified Sphingomonas]KQX19175.1 conjugal transfer protein TraI [Sphingomonas sp. Root1294]KQY65376.1 conjugal transfer protein TraI [Sphingomonas sp. Root50]KRB95329.1 conjugal transfer protein TraI [Sphingomonas sp. Root720]
MSEDAFEPRVGKMRSGGGKRARKYASRIIAAAARAGIVTGGRNRTFDGSRIGRGASMGRLLGSRDRLAAFRGRRAVVKTRLVRLGAKGLPAARAHLRYIQRDGVTREGSPGTLYSAELDQAEGKAFIERCDSDRHQFRFIVSAEDGAEYPDLKPFVRRLMTQVEEDLGTKLDWVAVDHFNTGHPHTHIMLRGVDDQGQNLVIAPEYLKHGFRARAAELVTLDLGPRTTQEIEARLRHDIDAERLTAIDLKLLRSMDADRLVAAADRDPFQQSLLAGRLQKLATMDLADNIGGGSWRLADGLEAALRSIGERGDIIRTMQRELTARKLDRPWIGRSLYGAGDSDPQPIVGRVIARGLADEHRDRHYLLVDGVDGHAHYVDIGRSDAVRPIPDGAIVRVSARRLELRNADRVVAEVAAANGGRYSIDLHLRQDPTATQAFAETHVRRLEAMRRAGVGVDRAVDESWTIPTDHIDRAAAYEARRHRDQPVAVETLSSLPLEQLQRADAATWLDRELAEGRPPSIRDAGLGREVRTALAARRQWLIEQGLAGEDGSVGQPVIDALQRRDMLQAADGLARALNKPFAEIANGASIEGKLSRLVELTSGRFALIERAHDFTLVPWRPMLEARIGQQVGGIMRADGISWRLNRGRSVPQIS